MKRAEQKNRPANILAAIILVSLCGCLRDTSPDYTVIEEHIAPGLDFCLEIDTVRKGRMPVLKYHIECRLPADFYYPVDTHYNDTLDKTEFRLVFMKPDGLRVTADSNILRAWNISTQKPGQLVVNARNKKIQDRDAFSEEKQVIKRNITLPLLVFHSLGQGQREIICEISLVFFDEHAIPDTSGNRIIERIESPATCLFQKIRFNLVVPKVLETELVVGSLKISDQTFTGDWDFKVFGPGTPDAFWSLYYPVFQDGGRAPAYFCSTQYTNTQECVFNDTVILYHYYADDTVGFNVSDWDNVSYNDFIGEWYGVVNRLYSDSGYVSITEFPGLEFFEVRAKTREVN
ncbi:MAG: hypothetical protein KJ607_13885 [Bacteroidetes bacterium]|nr:hypothetical protein [Bacteroidota bacterium]